MVVVIVASGSSHVSLDWLPIADAMPLLVLLSWDVAPILAASTVLAKAASCVFGAESV